VRRLRVACFGAGNVTQTRHIPAMRAQGGFDIVAIVDRRPERAADAAGKLGLPRHAAAEGVDELPFKDEIDAITCGTSPFAHHRVVKSALEAGKHAITEKPFTMTIAEGEELAELAGERDLALCIVHNFQFARSVKQLRRWADRGLLGEVHGVWGFQLSNPSRALPQWYDELPLGLFYDESPHLIYLVRALAGDLELLSATVHPSNRGLLNTPSQIDAQFRSGRVPVTLTMNFEAPVSEWQVAVIGERSLAVVDLFRDIAIRLPNDGGHRSLEVLRTTVAAGSQHFLGYLRSGPKHIAGRRLLYGNEEVFGRFHAAATDGVPAQGIGPDDALAVLRIQHLIAEAAEGLNG
jgi:scyllo-inositol 2-dehydrogenase (NADP+)